jgi:hypothetical protein
LVQNPGREDHLIDLRVDGRILLKWPAHTKAVEVSDCSAYLLSRTLITLSVSVACCTLCLTFSLRANAGINDRHIRRR